MTTAPLRTVFTSAAFAAAIALSSAGVASADTTPLGEVRYAPLGSSAELVDGAGTVVQAWTVRDLEPSSDTINYPVQGTLYEATATDVAVRGTVTPIVSNFNARAADGTTYRVLFTVATPEGVNPSNLAQGQETTGKLYFDVTGSKPDSVVYNAGGADLLVWTGGAAA